MALGAWLSAHISGACDRRVLLALAYLVQAGAIVSGMVWPGRTGCALGSLLLGLPFTAINFFALFEARCQWPAAGASFTGLLTALYGIGQIAGPPLVAWLLMQAATPAQGFNWALGLAAIGLVLSAGLYGVMRSRWANF